MKKIVSFAMAFAAIAFSACSSDDENPADNNGAATGMVLRATVEGQEPSSRATMSGNGESLTAENGKWTFSFSSGDNISASNTAVGGYYSFKNTSDNFVSSDAKATASAADWCAYFPGNDVSLADQDGSFENVANYYALAGTTSTATTGADGIDITMSPQVAVLRVVKVENQKFGACDVNVRTADGKYVAGLTARKGEAAFDVKTSDSKVTLLSKTTPGVYYIAVPAGVKLSIYNGDNLRNTTKDAGLTAGKYYTVLTGPITGTKEATINGQTVQIGWVQLYPGGAKIATQNVASKISWTDAAKTGDDYVWGKNWRTPTTAEMNIVNGDKILKSCGSEDGNLGFIFSGKFLGYTKNKIFLPANDKSVEYYMEGNYWSSEAATTDNGLCLDMVGGNKIFAYGNWSKLPKTSTNYVRPIVNE